MKALVKKLLPTPILNRARNVQAITSLATIPKMPCNAQNLKLHNELNLNTLLQGDQETIPLGNTDQTGGVNPGDRRAIYALISGLKPKNVLEIGTHIGASTINIASALKAIGKGKVTSVDICDVNAPNGPWKQLNMNKSPIQNVQSLGLENYIEFVQSPALNFMKSTSQTYDFIFLDGDHRAPSVYQEIATALDILNPNGIILLHDYYPNAKPLFPNNVVIAGPFRAGCRIQNENSEIVIKPLGALPWETKQGSKITSLALILHH